MVKKLTVIILCLLLAGVAATAITLGLINKDDKSQAEENGTTQDGSTVGGTTGNDTPSGGNGNASGGNNTSNGNDTSNDNTPPTAHVCSFVFNSTVDADCLNGGYDVYLCACGKSEQRNRTNPLDHNYEWTEHKATCISDWSRTGVCVRCKDQKTETVDDSKGSHDYEWTKTKDATCTEDGLKSGKCKLCGDVTEESVPALNHSYGAYKPDNNETCAKDGTETAICANCGDEDIRTIAGSKKAHSYGAYKPDNNATCIKDATETATCATCGRKDIKTIPNTKTDHNYGYYVSNNDATCVKQGTKSATCSGCGTKDTIPDPYATHGNHATDKIGATCPACNKTVKVVGGEFYETEDYGTLWFAYVINSLEGLKLTCDIFIVQYEEDTVNQTLTPIGSPVNLKGLKLINIWKEGQTAVTPDPDGYELWQSCDIELLNLKSMNTGSFRFFIKLELNEDEKSLYISSAFTQKYGNEYSALFEPLFYIRELSHYNEVLGYGESDYIIA